MDGIMSAMFDGNLEMAKYIQKLLGFCMTGQKPKDEASIFLFKGDIEKSANVMLAKKVA